MGMLDRSGFAAVVGDVAGSESPEGRVEQLGELFNTFGAPAPGRRVEQFPSAANNEGRSAESDPPTAATAEAVAGQLQEPGRGEFPAVVRRGRPATLTPQILEKLHLLLSVGLSRRQAAAYLNIDHTTVSRAASRDEELARDLKRAEELADVQPLLSLMAASRKHWRAAAWYLNHKAKHPAALSEEEKEQKHQARLADARRQAEYMRASTILQEQNDDAEEVRRDARNLAKQQAKLAQLYPPPKKRNKEDGRARS